MDVDGVDLVSCVIFAILGVLLCLGHNGNVSGIFGTAIGSYFTYKGLKYAAEKAEAKMIAMAKDRGSSSSISDSG